MMEKLVNWLTGHRMRSNVPALNRRLAASFRARKKWRLEPLECRVYLNASAEWDNADSHKWIGEAFGGDTNVVDWVTFDNRNTLRSRVTSSVSNYTVIRTDGFTGEDWRGKVELRADIHQVGGANGVDVKLEVRGPGFNPAIEAIQCNDLDHNAWKTCTWAFDTSLPGYGNVSHLSLVFDNLNNTAPTFYVDDMRLVTAGGTEPWDDMDDGSRQWFYGGNWFNWLPNREFGLELVTHNGANPSTPTGSLYLEWDDVNGEDPTLNTAEIGTNQLDDMPDWSSYNRVAADVKVSASDVPLSLFFWDAETQTGFGTPTRKAGVADSWQTVVWDVPWPPGFDNTDIDEVKFIVNDLDQHPMGELLLDNIRLLDDGLPGMLNGLDYHFASFEQDDNITEFSSNWGALGTPIATVTDVTAAEGSRGSLEVKYALPEDSFSGAFFSLWGNSDCKEGGPPDRCSAPESIDFTDVFGASTEDKDFEQIHFWVRGSGLTQNIHNVKVELKDTADQFEKTAYRYITIDDSNTQWQKVVLDADVLNGDFWSYNQDAPDPRNMKFLVFVVESFFNAPTGTFYIDNIKFVDADDAAFDPARNSNDAFLDLVSRRAFSYFLDWYEPTTGLFQDRSEFPDLMSIAATGFGLTALSIGAQRGWIGDREAIDMIARTLATLRNGQTANDTVQDTIADTNGYKGLYYHFLGTDGKRKDPGSELSSVDTAILLMGALTAKEHFSQLLGEIDAETDTAIQNIISLVDELYHRVEWDWMLDSAINPTALGSNRFFQAWSPVHVPNKFEIEAPGGGYFSNFADGRPLQWDYSTDEVMLINILAIGSPTHPVSKEVFYAWERNVDPDRGIIHSFNGSYFTYFFAHLWIQFQNLGQDQPPPGGPIAVDWWQNSVQATLANQQFAIEHADGQVCDNDDDYATYGANSFGFTASDGPDGNYHAYGALPTDPRTEPEHDGTIAPYGAASAIMFEPQIAISALQHFFADTESWNYRIGFGDAFSLDPPDCSGPWYNRAVFGIDNGPMLMAIENYRSGFVWETIQRNSQINAALQSLFSANDAIGVHRDRFFFKDVTADGVWNGLSGGDDVDVFGIAGDIPLAGDWQGDGFDEVGVARVADGALWFFLDYNGSGRWDAGDVAKRFGIAGDQPTVGDWNGDGTDDIGVHRGNLFYLDSNGSGAFEGSDSVFRFGNPGDTPIIGDWNGDGTDEIGVHRGNLFYQDANGSGGFDGGDVAFRFGNPGDTPIIGDWNGDGTDEIGVHRGNLFYQDANGSGGFDGGDVAFRFGIPGDAPIIGNWPVPVTLRAAAGQIPSQSYSPLPFDVLRPIFIAATELLADTGLNDQQRAILDRADLRIADLVGARLGQTTGGVVTVDVNAAGYGWFADPTPYEDNEFSSIGGDNLVAVGDSAAIGLMDLLTVVTHELGHLLGLDDIQSHGLMNGRLDIGVRRHAG